MKIAILTESRADWGGLAPVYREFVRRQKDVDVDYYDVREINLWDAERKGYTLNTEYALNEDTDFLVFLGDRPGVLRFVLDVAETRRHISLVHLSGGDFQEGRHVDEAVRDSLSRFADVHFPCTQRSADRLFEKAFSREVHIVGSTMVDDLRDFQPRKIPLFAGRPLGILNPCDDYGEIKNEIESKFPGVAWVEPNQDAGFEHIEFCPVVKSMTREVFFSALWSCSSFVGNSSALFLEAQYIGTPCYHYGERNRGREEAFPGHVNSGIDARTKGRLRENWRDGAHGDGTAARRILDVLETIYKEKSS